MELFHMICLKSIPRRDQSNSILFASNGRDLFFERLYRKVWGAILDIHVRGCLGCLEWTKKKLNTS